jgi:hypothetical protein
MRMNAPDLFTFADQAASSLPDGIHRKLAELARGPPLWPVPVGEWHEITDCVRRFADQWHRPATAAGWTEPQLYGLDDRAPYARLDTMGAAWIIARRRHLVLTVDRTAITVKSRSCAILRFLRR